MDFDDLLVFRSVARCRTLTKAVIQTGFSQSAISRRVQRLERELDATLLDRRTLPASLTEAGREFLKYADGVLEGRRVLDDRLSHSPLSGTLRVACSSAPADFGIPELVGTFLRSEPGVTVQWLAASSRAVQAQVIQGVAVLGFMGLEPEDCCLQSQIIGMDRIVLAVPQTDPYLTIGPSITVAELCSIPLVQRENGSGTRISVERALAGKGIAAAWRVQSEVNSKDAQLAAIAAGWGVGFASVHSLASHADRVRPVVLADMDVNRPIYMAWDPVTLSRNRLASRFQRLVLNASARLTGNVLTS